MRVFLCAFGAFTLAIPMHSVSSLSLYSETPYSEQDGAIMHDQQTQSACISLPLLFNLPKEEIWHCIFLKDQSEAQDKIILLLPRVDREIEIAEEDIYPMPKIFGEMRLSVIFSGILFKGGPVKDVPVFILNCEHLIQCVKKEKG